MEERTKDITIQSPRESAGTKEAKPRYFKYSQVVGTSTSVASPFGNVAHFREECAIS